MNVHTKQIQCGVFGALVAALCATASAPLQAQLTPAQYETPEFYANWGLDPIRAQYAWSQGFTGAGVRIAIVDSPIQLSHPEFAGRVWGEIPTNQFPVPGFPIPIHGTHVMGLAGAARNEGKQRTFVLRRGLVLQSVT